MGICFIVNILQISVIIRYAETHAGSNHLFLLAVFRDLY